MGDMQIQPVQMKWLRNNGDILFDMDNVFVKQIVSCLQMPGVNWTSAGTSGEKEKLNLLVLGKTGYGKSATGNTIFGAKMFTTNAFSSSVTSEVMGVKFDFGNYEVTIVDTPGFMDTNNIETQQENLEKAIEKFTEAVSLCPGGVHAFLYVMKFNNRITLEDIYVMDCLRQIFGNAFLAKHGIIVFTGGDLFESTMESEDIQYINFQVWCVEQKGHLRQLINECQHRVVLLNNVEKREEYNQDQRENLIHLISQTLVTPYTQNDYNMCEGERQILIFDVKVKRLTPAFQKEINKLQSDILSSTISENPTQTKLIRKVEVLELKIKNEDTNNTGRFKDLMKQLAQAKLQINELQRRQTEIERLRKKSTCQVEDLELKIKNEDTNNTGTFKDVMKQLAQAKLQINELQRRQTEIERLREKSTCSIF